MDTKKIHDRDYAIVGQSLRLPDANNIDEFWKNLNDEKVSTVEIPNERWDWTEKYGETENGNQKTLCKWGAFVENFRYFDNKFFNISEREAKGLDPQIRQFLQLTWSCFEDAGYNPKIFSGKKTGVFIGVCHNDFKLNQKEFDAYSINGTINSMLANRISFAYNLLGPSMVLDTACSSSLVALHTAIRAIEAGDCENAIIGGTNFIPSDIRFLALSDLGVLSSKGVSNSFDEEADGIILGEGVVVLLIKKLSDAQKSKDNIYAIIKGSAINHGGNARTVTSPNIFAQSNLIQEAYIRNNISPKSVFYIETHGTGTKLGDPIEINALKRSFHSLAKEFGETLEENTIPVGSVKPNVGHSEAAAGLTGILKIAKIFESGTVPALTNYKNLNTRISFDSSPFYIATKEEKLRSSKTPRRAGVSSFGVGGTNVHVILEEPLKNVKSISKAKKNYLIFSAATFKGLQKTVAEMGTYIEQHRLKLDIEDIAYTLQVGRKSFPHRITFECSNIQNALETMCQFEQENIDTQWANYNFVDKANRQLTLSTKTSLKQLTNKWLEGYEINWVNIWKDKEKFRCSLPTYIFEKIDFGLGNEHLLVKDSIVKSTDNTKIALKIMSHAEVIGEELSSNQINWTQKELLLQKDAVTSKNEKLKSPFSVYDVIAILSSVVFKDVATIGTDDLFMEIGLDSITGVEFINKVNTKFGLELNSTILYDEISPSKLYNFILSNENVTKLSENSKEIEKPQDEVIVNHYQNDSLKTINKVASILAIVLFRDIEISEYDISFNVLGLDSITGVEFINRINMVFGIKIDSTKLYDYTTLSELTNLISSIDPKLSNHLNNVKVTKTKDIDLDALLHQFENDAISIDDIIEKITKE
jgi:acyl transferase domain-containing protein/acyl carrier protein